MIFGNIALLPYALLLLLIFALFAAARGIFFRRVSFSNTQALAAASKHRGFMHIVPDALKAAALVFLIIALLRPQSVRKETQETIKGIDIMITLDLSGSMQADDLAPNRVEAAKEVCRNFVDGLSGDRVGLVVFAGKAFSQCPLTTDYGIIKSFIDQVDLNTVRIDGTAVGEAILNAVNRLEASKGTKVIILTTDGASNRGINPVEAAKIAEYKGVRIYTIGIGKKGGAPMMLQDAYGNKRQAYDRYTGQLLKWEEPDENSLTQVAEITGGRYFRAENKPELAQIYSLIAKLEKQDIKIKSFEKKEDRFVFFLWAGFLLALAALAIEAFFVTRVLS